MAREMKDSGIEWIGKSPSNWPVVLASQVFSQVKCKNSNLVETNLLSLSYGKIKRKNIDTTEGLLPESFDGYNIIECNDIVLRLTDLQNDHKSLRVGRSTERGIITSAYLTIRPTQGKDSQYLYYFLHSFDICKGLYGMGSGVRQGLNWDDIKRLQILLPSREEQHRIATFLDRMCAEIDSVIANTQRTIEEYKALKQSIITEAVTKGVRCERPMKDSGIDWITSIPCDWETIRVKYLLKERNERSVSGQEEPLSMSQKLGLVPTKELDMVPNMAASFVGAKLAYVDDLVFNKLKAHLGVFSVSKYDGLVSPDYAVYFSTGKADLKYLEYVFKTPQCIIEFRKKSTGIAAGLTRLYTDGLFSIVLPYPSLEEQAEIVNEINRKCSELDRLIAAKEQLVTELESYKKSVIYEYVTGKKEAPIT